MCYSCNNLESATIIYVTTGEYPINRLINQWQYIWGQWISKIFLLEVGGSRVILINKPGNFQVSYMFAVLFRFACFHETDTRSVNLLWPEHLSWLYIIFWITTLIRVLGKRAVSRSVAKFPASLEHEGHCRIHIPLRGSAFKKLTPVPAPKYYSFNIISIWNIVLTHPSLLSNWYRG
jgi:hypothetical protein